MNEGHIHLIKAHEVLASMEAHLESLYRAANSIGVRSFIIGAQVDHLRIPRHGIVTAQLKFEEENNPMRPFIVLYGNLPEIPEGKQTLEIKPEQWPAARRILAIGMQRT